MDRSRLLDEESGAGGDAEFLRRAAGFVYVDDLSAPQPNDDDRHHLLRVLRLRAGEVVIAADGDGSFVPCVVTDVGAARSKHRGQSRETEVLSATGAARSWAGEAPRTVAFAIPKGERAEWTVQKLTEIGIDRIVPLITERSVVRLDVDDVHRRGERFRRIAREAGAQSRRVRLPVVEDPMTIDRPR
jgi:16S rRNA (uracil1498-N3)-methyltransferase